MKKYDVFKSQGGYGVALGIYLGSPVVGSTRWFESKEDAETYATNRKKFDTAYKKWEESIGGMSYEEAKQTRPPQEKDFNLNVGITI